MNFGKYLYDQLPAHYRYRDIETEYTLERYLQCVGEFLNIVCKETGEIKDLLNVSKMPSKFLPYYAKTFGVTLYDDMPEDFQRKLLANIIPILKRKGTRDVIEFVAREITGYDVDVTEGSEYAFRTWVDELYLPLGEKQGLTYSSIQAIPYRYAGTDATSKFVVFIEIHTQEAEVTINEEIIRKYLMDLVPSYIKPVFVLNKHLVDEEDYSDIITVNVTEGEHSDIEVLSERTYGNVMYTIIDKLKFITEVTTVNNSVEYELHDKVNIIEQYILNAVIKEGDVTDNIIQLGSSDSSEVAPTPIPTPPEEETVLKDLIGAVVMGDSRFVAMNNLGKYFTGMTVDAKTGVSANYFYNSKTGVNRIVNYPKDASCFIILLGVNDPETSGRYYMKNMLAELRAEYPNTPIYVLQEYHMGANYENVDSINISIEGFNAEIGTKCKELGINHINCEEGLLNSSGLLDSKFTSDGCHLNESGYDILWINAKRQILETENTDETPVTLPSQDKTDPLYFPKDYKNTKITNNYQLVARAYDVLNNYNTVYLYGGIGQVLTKSVVNAKASQYPKFYTSSRIAKYNDYLNSGKTYWGFDCVNLYKSLLWGWKGDASKSYGGAKYGSNGVPDQSANGLFSYCTNKSSENWDSMKVGEALWLDGHFGIYVGGGKAIECTPSWTKIGSGSEWDGVQLTAVSNCSNYPTNLHARKWTKHGKLPYIDYLSKNPFINNDEDVADTTGTFVAQTYPANVTAYYPDDNELEGGYYDAIGNPLVGYPEQLTCAVPSNVPLGSKVMITGTNTEYDNKIFTATDRGGAIVVNNGEYCIDLCLQTYNACNEFGRHKGGNVKVSIGDVVTSSRKVAITKQGCNIRSGKGTSYSIVGKACSNYRFTVLDDSDEWIAVEYHGSIAYVKGTLLTIVTI